MMPDYFHEKVRLFVALAPIVRLEHTKSKGLADLSQVNEVVPPIVKLTHAYDLAPYDYSVNKVITSLTCSYYELFIK